ncbi:hypothetical protein [Neisseria yangbaofengii]|uniref:hypothetical protein n=1 Tax=Neisseria yangbaofengii TaxID=2709396 RepID=UPI001D031232|nr:hypothetical protein [Neisseria yangbaofengii]
MRGVSRNVMAGYPAIFYWYDMGDYQHALMQLDELIAYFCNQGEVFRAVAEAQDCLLIEPADSKPPH